MGGMMTIIWAKSNECVVIGEEVYLVVDVDLDTGHYEYRLQLTAPITNMGREPLAAGWLGTTNGVARYAMGKVIVIDWGNNDMVRVRRINHAYPLDTHR